MDHRPKYKSQHDKAFRRKQRRIFSGLGGQGKAGEKSMQNINLKQRGLLSRPYKEPLQLSNKMFTTAYIYKSLFWRARVNRGRGDAGNFSPTRS